MSIPTIRRLDDNRWGYFPQNSTEGSLRQIQIITPTFKEVALNWLFAQIVSNALQESNIHTSDQLADGLYISIADSNPSPLLGDWKISLVTDNSCWASFWQSIPMTRMINDKEVASVQATRCNAVFGKAVYSTKLSNVATTPQISPGLGLFEDAFTQLAALCLQTVEPFFVSAREVRGSMRFAPLSDEQITISEIPDRPFTDVEILENRAVVARYKQLMIQQHGLDKVQYVEANYGFCFNDMIDNGAPLMPDHVFKTNIGMNKIELGDVQRVYNTLAAVHSHTKYDLPVDLTSLFCQKELRKLCHKIHASSALPTMSQLSSFLDRLFEDPVLSVKELPADIFNSLVDIVMLTPEERERSFTGRKIYLYAISGSITLGDTNIPNPCSELFDVLQIFDQLETTDNWENYYELHSHITPKKSLYFKDSSAVDSTWHVGLLLPGPRNSSGESRWYYNEAFIDDNGGGVTYLLQPACNNYQINGNGLPFINLDRPTATCRDCVNWLESVAADLNPYGSPSSLYPDNSFHYHRQYINDRTLPLWVGYMLLAEKTNATQYYHKALEEYHLCLQAPGPTPPHKLAQVVGLKTLQDHNATRDFLLSEAELHKELPQYKIGQSVYWIGQSLGGAMAQFHTYYYGPRRHRIPVPGYTYYCYASRGPAIDTYQDRCFMEFGRAHSDVIAGLGPKWVVRQDLEYGDIFPQFGSSHLGTTGYDEAVDSTWLDADFTVFKPLDTAHALAITTMPTHGRRTGMAQEGLDFTKKRITVQTLSDFDHSWWMSGDLQETFGYVYMRSAKIAEFVRSIFSILSHPFMKLALWIHEYLWPAIGNRDSNGVWFIKYEQPEAVSI